MVISRTLTAFFQDLDGTKIPGLVASVTILDVTDGARTQVGIFTMPEFTTGLYAYTYASFDTKKEYIFMFDGGPTLDSMSRYKIAGVDGNAQTEDALTDIKNHITDIANSENIITQPS